MQLWVDKYRPIEIKDYVYQDDNQKKQIESWIKTKSIPHLLFSGSPGVGKTTLALILLHTIADPGDIMEINAANENNVEVVREKIVRFASTRPNGDCKYILLDEADFLTPSAQAALKGTIEQFSATCRFIFTCNLPHKVIAPIHSRCQGFHVNKLEKDTFTLRLDDILGKEKVEYEIEDLIKYIDKTYPDLRKCTNLLQQNSVNGKLLSPSSEDASTAEWMLEAIALFQEKKIYEARERIVKNIRPEEYEEFYRMLYRNLDWFGDTPDKKDEAILIIKDHLVSHTLCADSEINLSACLVKLSRI